jgi:hypothetical protein
MTVRVWSAVSACTLALTLASPAFAQSGEIACQQDVQRISELYNQKRASLSDQERQDVLELMEVARGKCSSGGSNALNTRSPEAVAVLEKLENAPMPSQAAVPEER